MRQRSFLLGAVFSFSFSLIYLFRMLVLELREWLDDSSKSWSSKRIIQPRLFLWTKLSSHLQHLWKAPRRVETTAELVHAALSSSNQYVSTRRCYSATLISRRSDDSRMTEAQGLLCTLCLSLFIGSAWPILYGYALYFSTYEPKIPVTKRIRKFRMLDE